MVSNLGPNLNENGLVLCLDAANSKSYPGTGTTWFDLSVNKNNAEGINMPTFTTGANGQNCFDFENASNHYFETINNSPFSGSNFPITVSTFISERSRRSYAGVLAQHDSANQQCMAFISYAGRYGTDHWTPSGRQIDITPSLDTVYNVTWVVDDWTNHQAGTAIYLNGELAASSATGSGNPTAALIADKFIIGNWLISRVDMDWDGQIYSISVYDRALSAAEVKQNFNVMRGRYGL